MLDSPTCIKIDKLIDNTELADGRPPRQLQRCSEKKGLREEQDHFSS